MKHSVTLCAILIACISTSCSLLENWKEEQEKIVKITPLFSKKVQQYDYLSSFSEGYAAVMRELPLPSGGVKQVWTFIDVEGNEIPQCQYQHAKDFSEGLAAVMKDGKYGYINTKGEVIIPFEYDDANIFSEGIAAVVKGEKHCYINKECVEVISISNDEECVGCEITLTPFCEDLAFVIKPNGWEYFEYYAIDKTGKKLFEGKLGGWCAEEGGRFNADYIPKIQNGEVYVPSEDYDTYDVYNKQGQKLRTAKGAPKNNEYYEIISESVPYGEGENINRFGMRQLKKDENDTTKLGFIPTIYDDIHYLNNGVALVCIYEYDKEALIYGEVEGGYIANTHYGYADLYGNDTFSDEIKRKCARSFDKAETNLDAYNEERRNPQWLRGTWRMSTDNGYIYKIFNNGKCTTYFECYSHVDEENYSISDGRIIIEGSDVSMILDCDKDIVIIEGNRLSKISNSTTINSSLQGANASTEDNNSYSDNNYSNERYSSNTQTRIIEFTNSNDAYSYVRYKKFEHSSGATIEVAYEGIFLNGRCATYSPVVETFNRTSAIISANVPPTGKIRIAVYPNQNMIVDLSSGEKYYYKK